MKKMFSLIGVTCIALIMSFSVTAHQSSASSTPISSVENIEEVSPYAASRYVVEAVVSVGKIVPANTYYYSDHFGYKGFITLASYTYDSKINRTTATYAGTVYCGSSYCPSPNSINK